MEVFLLLAKLKTALFYGLSFNADKINIYIMDHALVLLFPSKSSKMDIAFATKEELWSITPVNVFLNQEISMEDVNVMMEDSIMEQYVFAF